jgi:AraC-like DNA-binding protein
MPVRSFGVSFDDEFLENFKNKWFSKDRTTLSKYNFINKIESEFSETIYPLNPDMAFNIGHLKYHLDNGVQDEQLLNEYLTHCLINYYRIYKEEVFQKAECLGSSHAGTKLEILRRLSLAREYLYTNYNQNISLEELAEYACLSVTHLLRTFKCAFRITPHQFLIRLRLQRALLFLKETDYPVNEVVSLVGFECASSFIRLFREHFNTTPLQYRQIA